MNRLDLPRRDGRPPVGVQVWGPQALFTRPQFRAERDTYPMMTPSAARGVLGAIFNKPEFVWWPAAIEVLSPLRTMSVTVNEYVSRPRLERAAAGLEKVTLTDRTQRSMTVLREVAYRIWAYPIVAEYARRGSPGHPPKNAAAYADQFERRVRKGQCFAQPFLGARDFPGFFAPPDEQPAIDLSMDLGVMIHSTKPAWTNPHGPEGPGRTHAEFEWFHARLQDGVLHVPLHGDFTTGQEQN